MKKGIFSFFFLFYRCTLVENVEGICRYTCCCDIYDDDSESDDDDKIKRFMTFVIL